MARWSCDEYYYLLGLAAELAKNPKDAIDAYLNLWRNYTRSRFTTMARQADLDRRDAYPHDHEDADDHTRDHIDARDANGNLRRDASHTHNHPHTDAHAHRRRSHGNGHFHTRVAAALPDHHPLPVTRSLMKAETWRVLHTPPARGAWNMAVDEAILEGIAQGLSSPRCACTPGIRPACAGLCAAHQRR